MAFLDNSGDIILDAVLTDTGRRRMAQGRFTISQFALGDDEIDYSLYDKNAANSAYYDLKILQTPILESFTNNMSSLKSKLVTIDRMDFLHLPVLKLYNLTPNYAPNSTIGMHIVAVDNTTETTLINESGIIKGFNSPSNVLIRVDQGIDSVADGGVGQKIDSQLSENGYIIEIDNRLGSIIEPNTTNLSQPNYIDDDNIASYFVFMQSSTTTNLRTQTVGNFIFDIPSAPATNPTSESPTVTVLQGRRGTALQFSIKSNTDLAANDYLFNKLGSNFSLGSTAFKFIDTTVRITGLSTGYRMDIPVRFVKQ